MTTAYVGLGSNLGEPLKQVKSAVAALNAHPLIWVNGVSSWYSNAPVGPQDQPDYVNGAVKITTHLSPLALLDALQLIENNHLRVRQRRWGERTLDLDILLYDDQIYNDSRLTIPHKELTNRSFVVFPLLEISPELRLPNGEHLHEVANTLANHPLTRIHEHD